MELTRDQEKNLITALKQYRVAKGQMEAAQKNLVSKFDKLKTCMSATGNDHPAVLAQAYELLANIYVQQPEAVEE